MSAGEEGGSRPCRFGGWERRLARWPPWPATMARGARGQGSRSQKTRNKLLGEIEGRTASLTAGKKGDGDARRRRSVRGRRRRTASAKLLRVAITNSEAWAKTEWRGAAGGRLGCGLRFKEARRGEGRSHDARRPGAGGCLARLLGRARKGERGAGPAEPAGPMRLTREAAGLGYGC